MIKEYTEILKKTENKLCVLCGSAPIIYSDFEDEVTAPSMFLF